jgi:polar amino acid transport system substrate-binding protein
MLIVTFLIITMAGIFAAACTASSPSPTPPSTTTGQPADTGKAIFASHCARCHGANGQGVTAPTVIGTNSSLDKYNTAQGLYNFVSTAMPANAPGSLSQQDYLDVVTFLLVQDKYISPGTVLNTSQLGSISLK